MNIVVCVKRVPDTETKIKSVEERRCPWSEFIISPFDESDEEAIRVKEKLEKEITILSWFADAHHGKAYAGERPRAHLNDATDVNTWQKPGIMAALGCS
jgi:electron transfer flavoprotein alpha/beta subunit